VVDCIVNLPGKLFLNTQIPACLWFLNRDTNRQRKGEVLFIDARNQGHLINRRTLEFTDEDIAKVSETYHHWLNSRDAYEDVAGFCKSVPLAEIAAMDYVMTPGRYIGLPDEEDDFDFEERFAKLQKELEQQMKEEVDLNKRIQQNLQKIQLVK